MATTPEQQAPAGFRAKFAEKSGALSNAKYRRYWLGSLASVGAIQIVTMAQGWLIVDKLGGSTTDIGILGGATAVPTILVSLFGGVFADRVDRRKLIMVVSIASTALLLLLAILDATNVILIWHVVLIAAVQGLVMGFDGPVRSSYFPLLIERKHMSSAVMLGTVMWQFSRLVTPIIGGILITVGGTQTVFFVGVLGWASMLLVMISLRVSSPPVVKSRNVLGDIVEGVKFILSRRDFVLLIGLTYSTHFFGMQYLQLMPFFAKRFEREADGFGIMLSVLGLGALAGTFTVGKVRASSRVGYFMLGGTLTFTAAVVAFAFAPSFYVALSCLFVGGLANTIFFVIAMTALQLRVPEQMRGRVMGIYTITFSFIPLGGVMGGYVASVYDERIAVAIGAAILASIFIAIGISQPIIRNLNGSNLEDA
ncbi:MAG: MFS transporter [Chloroflexi bacterium]|nr:MFS transporter [Chloroflexota bacterium]MBT7004672.1 MFS transporter [Chloroflexota bacterium]MBT7079266.1 MFS transporter [Chloroflexota bacterium]MBT7833475.1 MFS transporter [Chloroflexota bacterium]